MKNALVTFIVSCALAACVQGCKESESDKSAKGEGGRAAAKNAAADTHADADGGARAGHGSAKDNAEDHGHEHDEVPLGTATIGDMTVELAQGHGKLEAGKEGHLVVKLPYNDKGASIVRAWIGTDDRLKSVVGKGEYAPSHDDYDVHAVAPDPLSENAMWWVEIEKPDGTKVVGSAKPLVD